MSENLEFCLWKTWWMILKLALYEIRKNQLSFSYKRVDTREEYEADLSSSIRIIISDYAMPRFDGMHALMLKKEQQSDVPFIHADGFHEWRNGVACMKAGLMIMLSKKYQALHMLLPPLGKAAIKKEKKLAEQELSPENYARNAVNNLPSSFTVLTTNVEWIHQWFRIGAFGFISEWGDWERDEEIFRKR